MASDAIGKCRLLGTNPLGACLAVIDVIARRLRGRLRHVLALLGLSVILRARAVIDLPD